MYDASARLEYNHYRYYDLSRGGYNRPDPIGITKDFSDPQLQVAIQMGLPLNVGANFDGRLNHLYNYVNQNPINYVDPFGLLSNTCLGIACWFIFPGSRPIIDVGISGTIGSTTISYTTNNPNTQWGQTTQVSVGVGGTICFNLPQSSSNQSCPVNSQTNNNNSSPLLDNFSIGLGRNFGTSISSNGSFCINLGPSVGLPLGFGWNL